MKPKKKSKLDMETTQDLRMKKKGKKNKTKFTATTRKEPVVNDQEFDFDHGFDFLDKFKE